MTYTAENIENIKRDNKLSDYIDHTERLIAELEKAKFEEKKISNHVHMVYYAHFHAEIEPYINENDKYCVSVSSYFFSGQWENFVSENAAMQYARAAWRNNILKKAKEVLAIARSDLEALKAAV